MKRLRSKNIDMTEGPLFGKIILYVLPFMASNLLQVLYNAADMIVVGLSAEGDAVGAIGTCAPFINLILNIFIGFASGANVVLARSLGAKNDREASRAVHTAVIMSLIFGIGSMLLGILITRPVLSVMGAEGKLLDLAVKYTVIYLLGAPFISLTNYAVAIFRAKGDTRTPLYVLSLSGLLNVLLNLFFVLVCSLSVEGVALATLLSNLVSSLVLLLLLSKERGPCRFSVKQLRLDKKAFVGILKIGCPTGAQAALASISNIIIQSSVLTVNNLTVPANSAFSPVVKGNAAAANLESFTFTATNSVYQASITFTGQNVGAGRYDRVSKVMRNCYLITFVTALIFSSVTLILNKPLLTLYGVSDGAVGSPENIAYRTAFLRLLIVGMSYFLLALMDLGCGIAHGLGKSTASAVITLIGSCFFRVIWIATVFPRFLTLESIYISYPIAWTLTAISQFVFVTLTLNRIKKEYKTGDLYDGQSI